MMRAASAKSLAVAGFVLLAGCAPVTGSGPFSIGMVTGGFASLSQCAPLAASGEAAGMGIHSSAIQNGSLRNMIQQLQSRFALGFSAGNESWTRIASGEC